MMKDLDKSFYFISNSISGEGDVGFNNYMNHMILMKTAAICSRGDNPLTELSAPITILVIGNEDEIEDSSLKSYIRFGGDPARFVYCSGVKYIDSKCCSEDGEYQCPDDVLDEQRLSDIIRQTGCGLVIIDSLEYFLPDDVFLQVIDRQADTRSAKDSLTKYNTHLRLMSIISMLDRVARKMGVAIIARSCVVEDLCHHSRSHRS